MRYVAFIKESCPFCVKAVELLEEQQKKVKIVNFQPDQEGVLQEIKDAYEWPTVPMIFKVENAKSEFIGGYTDLVTHFEQRTS